MGKAYDVYARPVDVVKEWLWRRPYHETFWALRDVSFSLPRGTSFAVIGDNGAGKTTLLKLLAGTILPTCGSIERNGRIGAILELGTGFHPDLSGMENIRLGCSTLGLSPAETAQRVPEIVAFSELEKFIERPIKTYSTGMHARLAFSLAVCVDPDILIVDEVLSVGDQHFQKKSMDRMVSFWKRGNTVIFCSHALSYVRKFCESCLWLRDGRPEMIGSTQEVIDCYEDFERSLDAQTESEPRNSDAAFVNGRTFGGDNRLIDVSVNGDCRDKVMSTGETLMIRVVVRLTPEAAAEGAHLSLLVNRNDNVLCCAVNTETDGAALYPIGEDRHGICLVVEELPLLPGQYSLDVALMDGNNMHAYDYWKGVAPFRIRNNALKEVGIARIKRRWDQP